MQSKKQHRMHVTRLATLGVAALLSGSAMAGNVTWSNTGGGSWSTASNWSTGAVPGSNDVAQIRWNPQPGAAVTISLDAPQAIAELQFPTYGNQNTTTIGTAADVTAGNTLTLTNVLRGDNVGNWQIIAANVALSDNSRFTIRPGYNSGVAVSGAISGAKSLTKDGTGTLELSGANTFSGGTFVNLGNFNLNFNTGIAPSANILRSDAALALAGGSMTITGKNTANALNSQTVNGLTIGNGASNLSIANTISSGKTLVALGAITRNVGGTINFTQPTVNTTISATNGFTTSTGNDAGGILGGYATVAGTDWATNNGTNIVKLAAYTADTWATGNNTNVTADASITDGITHSLRFNSVAARTLTLNGTNVIASGGIMVTSTVAANATTVSGGTLTSGGADLIIYQNNNNAAGAMTISSAIADNGLTPVALTKAGAGNLIASGTLSYTGGTYVNAGTLTLTAGSVNPLATTGKIVVSGGTLALGSGTTQSTSGDVVIRGGTLSGGTLTKSGTDYDGQAGAISAVLAGSVGLVKTTGGSLALSGANTYTGDTWVKEGALSASVSGSIKGNLLVGNPSGGPSASYSQSNTPLTSSKKVTVYANGSADMGSSAQNLSNIEIIGGSFSGGSQTYMSSGSTITMTAGTLSGNFYSFTPTVRSLASDTTATVSAGLQKGAIFDVADGTAAVDVLLSGTANSASSPLTKNGAGVLKATGNNGYTGATAINGGTLWVSGAGNINSTSSITVNNAAVFQYDSSAALTKIPTLNSTATFIYNSSAKLGGNITIASGRTLGGSGTLAGVTVNGNLKPGNSPGQITMDSLVLGSTALTTMEIGGATLGTQYDNINILNSASLTYGGTLDVVAYGGYDLAQAGNYTLFTFTGPESGDFTAVTVGGTSLTNNAGIWSGTLGSATYTFSEATGQLAVVIPEPGTMALAAGVALVGLIRRQRARR